MAAVDSFPIPRNLTHAPTNEGRRAWLERLPELVKELERRWSLVLSDPFQPGGQTAWVAPGHSGTLGDVVLKVAWRHTEAAHEADGLREWNGDGVVRLYATEEFNDTIVLLLERCVPGTTLAVRPESDQDTTIAGLLRRLWRQPTPDHGFRSLQVMCDAWADEFEQKVEAGRSSLDPGLTREGAALFRSLPASAETNVLLCTDLHGGNVLAAKREPWLVIDPKPYVGDPTYDPLQHLLNCEKRLQADPSSLTQRMADLLELEADRLLLWLFARCVVESVDWPTLAPVAERTAPA
jgi:streptomycin 6-kinase